MVVRRMFNVALQHASGAGLIFIRWGRWGRMLGCSHVFLFGGRTDGAGAVVGLIPSFRGAHLFARACRSVFLSMSFFFHANGLIGAFNVYIMRRGVLPHQLGEGKVGKVHEKRYVPNKSHTELSIRGVSASPLESVILHLPHPTALHPSLPPRTPAHIRHHPAQHPYIRRKEQQPTPPQSRHETTLAQKFEPVAFVQPERLREDPGAEDEDAVLGVV